MSEWLRDSSEKMEVIMMNEKGIQNYLEAKAVYYVVLSFICFIGLSVNMPACESTGKCHFYWPMRGMYVYVMFLRFRLCDII